MTCENEEEKLDAAEREQDEADISLETARRKTKNGLKGAGAACVGGAVVGLLGGPVGLLGGGGACITGLLVADDLAADFEAAQRLAEMAAERASEARIKWYLCMSKLEPGGRGGDVS